MKTGESLLNLKKQLSLQKEYWKAIKSFCYSVEEHKGLMNVGNSSGADIYAAFMTLYIYI